jgi:two-component system, OmpR family, phosphate regulon sensor histidine kinase PhoR
MIKKTFFQYFKWQLTALVVLTFIAYFYGLAFEVYAVAITAIMLYNGYQQRKLFNWLASNSLALPPESRGLWGQLFDRLYVRQRKHKKKQEQLRERLKRMVASAQSLQSGVIMISKRGGLQWWNQSASNMLGLENNDKNLPLTNILRDPAFIEYFDKKNFMIPITIHSPLNRELTLEIAISTYNDNERLLLVRDISRLRYLEKMRQDFVSNASHELRTPLTVLTGYLETFLDQDDLVPKPMSRGLKQMQQQCHRMNHLVEDLLALTRLDNVDNAKDYTEVNVQDLVTLIYNDANALSGDRQHVIAYSIPDDAVLFGKESELRSAIANLVFNAVNYSPAKSHINISWHNDKRNKVLQVKDNGQGIESHHLPRLTERFYRIDNSRNSATGGTGLGLAIVKHILQHHNAYLDIASQVGEGSTFSCVFESQ